MNGMLVVGLLGAISPAGTWAIAPFEAINVHEGHVLAARAVLKAHLESLGQPAVMLDSADGAAVVELARQQGADAVVRGSLTRLGSKVKTRLMLDGLDGARQREGTLDAMSPEDLDTVLLRLARHLVHGDPLEENAARIDEVTEEEEEAYARRQANSYFGVMVSGIPVAAGERRAMLAGGSIYWLYDMRYLLADMQLGFGIAQGGQDGEYLGFTVGLLYPFTRSDITPFAGLGLGYCGFNVDQADGSGLQLLGDIGILVGRASTVHFRADVRPFLTLYELGAQGLGYGGQVTAGIGF